jgi:hypothetical protein
MLARWPVLLPFISCIAPSSGGPWLVCVSNRTWWTWWGVFSKSSDWLCIGHCVAVCPTLYLCLCMSILYLSSVYVNVCLSAPLRVSVFIFLSLYVSLSISVPLSLLSLSLPLFCLSFCSQYLSLCVCVSLCLYFLHDLCVFLCLCMHLTLFISLCVSYFCMSLFWCLSLSPSVSLSLFSASLCTCVLVFSFLSVCVCVCVCVYVCVYVWVSSLLLHCHKQPWAEHLRPLPAALWVTWQPIPGSHHTLAVVQVRLGERPKAGTMQLNSTCSYDQEIWCLLIKLLTPRRFTT